MAKKRNFIVVPRSRRVINEGLTLDDGKHISFRGKTAKNITDPGVADAIEQKYGLTASGVDAGSVWTERDERGDHAVNYHMIGDVHNYFFGAPNTRAYRDNYDRIFGRKK